VLHGVVLRHCADGEGALRAPRRHLRTAHAPAVRRLALTPSLQSSLLVTDESATLAVGLGNGELLEDLWRARESTSTCARPRTASENDVSPTTCR
jgi:hypothetical protein